MPTLRWLGALLVISALSRVILPAVGVSNPATIRSVVVLPQPEGPRNETNSPFSTSRLKFWTANESANFLETSVRVKYAMLIPVRRIIVYLRLVPVRL